MISLPQKTIQRAFMYIFGYISVHCLGLIEWFLTDRYIAGLYVETGVKFTAEIHKKTLGNEDSLRYKCLRGRLSVLEEQYASRGYRTIPSRIFCRHCYSVSQIRRLEKRNVGEEATLHFLRRKFQKGMEQAVT